LKNLKGTPSISIRFKLGWAKTTNQDKQRKGYKTLYKEMGESMRRRKKKEATC